MMDALQTMFLGAVGLLALATLVLRWDAGRQHEQLRMLAEAHQAPTPAALAALIEHERDLLMRVLTPEQAAQYRTVGFFEVNTAAGRRYRLGAGMTYNVIEMSPGGTPVATLCIGTSRFTSMEGQLAAQVLLLTTNEDTFRKIANIRHY